MLNYMLGGRSAKRLVEAQGCCTNGGQECIQYTDSVVHKTPESIAAGTKNLYQPKPQILIRTHENGSQQNPTSLRCVQNKTVVNKHLEFIESIVGRTRTR